MLDNPEMGRLLFQTSADESTWTTERTFDNVLTRLEVNETMQTNDSGDDPAMHARYKRTK